MKEEESGKTEISRNADNEFLGPIGGGGFCIGHVDEVNGWGAREVSEFPVTRHELLELVKYWMKRYLDNYYFCFVFDQSGSTEIRLGPYALRRIDRIAEVLGDDVVEKAVKEAEEEFAKSADPVLWKAFQEGDTATRDANLERIYGEMNREQESSQEIGDQHA